MIPQEKMKISKKKKKNSMLIKENLKNYFALKFIFQNFIRNYIHISNPEYTGFLLAEYI